MITLDLTNHPNFFDSPTSTLDFTIDPQNNLAAYYYEDSTYQNAETVSLLSLVVCGLAWLTFFLGMFLSRKFIGVEMMGILQVSFIALICF